MDDDPSNDNEGGLESIILVAIVVGSTGLLLMILGAVYYLSRLGDVPSRKSVAGDSPENEGSLKDSQSDSPLQAADDKPTAPREELIEIYAPAGKLGVILDTPGEGPPTVHEVRDNSVLKDEIQVGDRVIALDDEDVRDMSSNKLSKMISRKMDNATRKFSVIRTLVPDV